MTFDEKALADAGTPREGFPPPFIRSVLAFARGVRWLARPRRLESARSRPSSVAAVATPESRRELWSLHDDMCRANGS